MAVLYLLLAANAALSGLTLASAMRTEAAVVESEVFTLAGTTVYIHGRFLRAENAFTLAGGTASLYYNGRLLRSSTAVAGGAWGFEDSTKTGLYQLRFAAPPGWTVVGIEKPLNVTDFEILADWQAVQFRVSPNGGLTGDFYVYCANLQTPTATWIPTPTLTPIQPTVTRTMTPSATPTETLVPVTPSPTWTPGPTPTACFVQASAEEIAVGVAAMSAQHPLGNDPVTKWAIDSGLGWPMTVVECVTIGGEQVCGQLFSQFTIVFRRANGCIAIVDSGSIQGVMP